MYINSDEKLLEDLEMYYEQGKDDPIVEALVDAYNRLGISEEE